MIGNFTGYRHHVGLSKSEMTDQLLRIALDSPIAID